MSDLYSTRSVDDAGELLCTEPDASNDEQPTDPIGELAEIFRSTYAAKPSTL